MRGSPSERCYIAAWTTQPSRTNSSCSSKTDETFSPPGCNARFTVLRLWDHCNEYSALVLLHDRAGTHVTVFLEFLSRIDPLYGVQQLIEVYRASRACLATADTPAPTSEQRLATLLADISTALQVYDSTQREVITRKELQSSTLALSADTPAIVALRAENARMREAAKRRPDPPSSPSHPFPVLAAPPTPLAAKPSSRKAKGKPTPPAEWVEGMNLCRYCQGKHLHRNYLRRPPPEALCPSPTGAGAGGAEPAKNGKGRPRFPPTPPPLTQPHPRRHSSPRPPRSTPRRPRLRLSSTPTACRLTPQIPTPSG
jgi:hypothetical protein